MYVYLSVVCLLSVLLIMCFANADNYYVSYDDDVDSSQRDSYFVFVFAWLRFWLWIRFIYIIYWRYLYIYISYSLHLQIRSIWYSSLWFVTYFSVFSSYIILYIQISDVQWNWVITISMLVSKLDNECFFGYGAICRRISSVYRWNVHLSIENLP